MMQKETMFSHLCGIFIALIWGTTFLVSKSLLTVFTPIQVMILRFFLAYVMLWILYPRWEFDWKNDFSFFLMSLFGNTLYYLAENSALTYTYSSNVSILVSAAPVCTAVLALFLRPTEKPSRSQLTGIAVAFLGMVLVVLNGSLILHMSPLGDLLSLGAAFCWGIYSVLLARYANRFSSFFLSRKLMFYGLVTSLGIWKLQGDPFPIGQLFSQPALGAGILFLGLVGSALCYIAWNKACAGLGIITANMYIYLIPFVTLAAGAMLLGEPITFMAVIGAVLISAGLLLGARK